ncbi:hypothetical protein [Mariprofundus ferrooxydans]|uniref:hypothetical protein n=1 Tax=Mariprofundus ferrooxydans TaxID=314344 RepID=UPI001E6071C1|nr:hypothetical protein [Mariprofundus ferrooxydans]
MKKSVLLFFLCMFFVGCSKSPGSQETGYRGIPWGSGVGAVARVLNVTPKLSSANSMFGSYYQDLAPRQLVLLEKGFSMLLTGNSEAALDGIGTLKGMSVLNEGRAGYSLFFNKKFGMNLHVIQANDYQRYHDKLMKRYGVIDKKLEYRANGNESSYFIMWHDADGVIILAKETYKTDSPHLVTSTQIIHMQKQIFDAISSDLLRAG